MLTPETGFAFDSVRPERDGPYHWDTVDELFSFAASNNIQIRNNTFMWHTQLPQWFLSLDKEEAKKEVFDYIINTINRYKDWTTNDNQKLIFAWEIALEAFYTDPNSTSLRNDDPFWSKFDSDEERVQFISEAFSLAKSLDPNANFLYDDASAELWGWPKTQAVYNFVETLRRNNSGIDMVGLECHFPVSFSADYNLLGENIRQLGALGLDVQITSLDSWFQECSGSLDDQALVYSNVLSQALTNLEYCSGFSTWGFTDDMHWIPWCDNLPDWYIPGAPCTCAGKPGAAIFDENYNPKPAYDALKNTLIAARTAAASTILSFVDNMYESFLGVTPDSQEAMQWVEALQSGSETAASLVQRLSADSQSITQNMTDSEYISHMFRTTLGGTPNEDGMEVYRELLSTRTSRNGFTKLLTESKAFADTYKGYWMKLK